MSLTTNKNFLQPTGFRVIIDREKYANLEFFAQSVNHPGSAVDAREIPLAKLQHLPISGDKISYSELSINLIVDEDMTAYKEMQSWLERTVAENDTTSLYNDITVVILTSHNNANRQIRYKNCIPVSIGTIEFTSIAGDTTFVTFDATFRYSEFEIQ